MLKSRLLVAFATLVALGLMTQATAFARPQQSDNPSEKTSQTNKSSKKKKKKKTTTVTTVPVPYVFMPQQVAAPTQQAAPVVVQSVDLVPATPEAPMVPATRNVSRETKNPG